MPTIKEVNARAQEIENRDNLTVSQILKMDVFKYKMELVQRAIDELKAEEEEKENFDLLENYETLPEDFRAIVDAYSEEFNDGGDLYGLCAKYVDKLQEIGYTAEYGLDGDLHSLRKMTAEEVEELLAVHLKASDFTEEDIEEFNQNH